jgi:ubiquinone/menaquinone biosynthesis C-methylase UbiE
MSKIIDSALGRNPHTCPSWFCFTFDNYLRKKLQNPYKTLMPYIKEGDKILDIGPGKGYFTIPIADIVGPNGKVIAADIQESMLNSLRKRADKFGVTSQIDFHLARPNSLLLNEKVDFALAFWMLHEVKDQKRFLSEIKNVLKKKGKLLIAEPNIHVTEKMFNKSLDIAAELGFNTIEIPKIFFSRAVILQNN